MTPEERIETLQQALRESLQAQLDLRVALDAKQAQLDAAQVALLGEPAARDLLGIILFRLPGHEVRIPEEVYVQWERKQWALQRWDDFASREVVYRLVPVDQVPEANVEINVTAPGDAQGPEV